MTVTVLYFDGCPHWETVETRLRTALGSSGRDDSVHSQRVETMADAQAVGFTGSPTILIDGKDPFGDPTAPASLSCRIYRTPDGLAGSPTVAQLVEVLR